MAAKKNPVRKPAAGSGAQAKPPLDKPSPSRKNPQPRVWRRVAKLASDAISALDRGNLAEARSCLEAIRAVGLSAEKS